MERAEKERLKAQWTADKEQLQKQVQESSLAFSQAVSKRVHEIERTRLEAVEDFKSNDAFTEELASHNGKAMQNSLRSIKGDLECLYPSVDLSMISVLTTCASYSKLAASLLHQRAKGPISRQL